MLKRSTPVPLTRIAVICTLAAACVLPSNAAVAFCSKPITPYCVEDGSLSDNSYVPAERCRRALEDHVRDLTTYRECLTAEISQIDKALEQFQGLLGGEAQESRSLPAASGPQSAADAAG